MRYTQENVVNREDSSQSIAQGLIKLTEMANNTGQYKNNYNCMYINSMYEKILLL